MPDIDPEPTTTLPGEGVSGQTPVTQAADPGTQVPDQTQEPGSSQVEVSDTNASSRDRTRPSQFYADRQRIKRLESTISQIAEQNRLLIERFDRQVPVRSNDDKQPMTADDFFRDPVGMIQRVLDEREERIKEPV